MSEIDKDRDLEGLIGQIRKTGRKLPDDLCRRFYKFVGSSVEQFSSLFLQFAGHNVIKPEKIGEAFQMFNSFGDLFYMSEYLPDARDIAGTPGIVRTVVREGADFLPLDNERISSTYEICQGMVDDLGPIYTLHLQYPGKNNLDAARCLSELFKRCYLMNGDVPTPFSPDNQPLDNFAGDLFFKIGKNWHDGMYLLGGN